MPPLRILVLEDNPLDTELMLRELRRAGFEDPEWLRVDSEEDYLDHLHADLDIILSDFEMPQFNGLRALELLKERGFDIPFILISGTIGEDVAVQAMKRGAADYLLKDRLARLGAAIQHALDESRLRRERKAAWETLRLRESALNEVSQGVIICDEKHLITYANTSFSRITGYSQDEIMGRNCNFLQGVDTSRETIQKMRAAIRAGQPFEAEILNYRKDGQPFWNDLSISPIRGIDGEPLRFIGIQRDITERKLAEEALSRKETELRVLFDLVPAMIWFKDTENNHLRVNKHAAASIGRSVEELEGKPARHFYPKEADGFYAADLEVMRSGLPKLGIVEAIRDNRNQDLWLQTDKVPYCDEDGQVIGIVVMSQDITARKLADAALKESELRYHTLFENMVEGYCYCRLLYAGDKASDYIYLEVNQAFAPQTGLTNVVGRKVSEVVPGIHESNPEQLIIYSRVASTGKTEKFETHAKVLDLWFSVSVYSNRQEHFVAVFDNITERKHAEEALRKSEERFAEAFEQAPIGIALLSPEGRWLKVNKALCDTVGYSEQELVSRTFHEMTHPEDLPVDLALVRRLVAGEISSDQLEKRYIHADGHFVPVLLNVSLVRDGQGEPLYFIAQIQDITERMRAQEELHWKTAFLEAQVNSSLDATIVVDEQGRKILQNQKVAELFKIPQHILDDPDDEQQVRWVTGMTKFPEEFARKVTHLYAHPDDIAHDEIALNNGTILDRYTFPVVGQDGKYYGRTWTFRDISERKQAEEELRASRHFAESIAENSTSVIYLYDLQTHVTDYTNRNAAEDLGYSKAQISAAGDDFYRTLIHPDDLIRLVPQTIKLTEAQDGQVFDFELRVKHATGELRWFWTRETVFNRHPDGTPWKILGTAHDITERKIAEEKLSEALAQEKELSEKARAGDRAKNEFLAVMSHEVRTPMNGIMGFAELLSQAPLSPENHAYAQTIVQSGEALTHVLDGILDFSRLEAGRLQVADEVFSPRALLRDIHRLMAHQAAEKNVKIQLTVADSIPGLFQGDAGRLRQIVLNVVGNAMKFTQQGTISIALEHHPDQPSTFIFTIKDTGVGITDEQIGRIFQPFTQADSSISRKYGGTGLGLTISRRLAELMGGELTVKSKPGTGSTFFITLPFAIATATHEAPSVAPPETLDGEFALRHPLRLLVVEDDRINLKLIQALLRRLGYSPLTAGNGRAAIEVFQRENPDCILMDLQMPEMDGIEASIRIRALEKSPVRPPVFIAALTANIFPADRQRCLEPVRHFDVQK